MIFTLKVIDTDNKVLVIRQDNSATIITNKFIEAFNYYVKKRNGCGD